MTDEQRDRLIYALAQIDAARPDLVNMAFCANSGGDFDSIATMRARRHIATALALLPEQAQ